MSGNPLNNKQVRNQSECLIHYFHLMDLEMINELLDNKLTYQNLDKCVFVRRLNRPFTEFIAAGDTRLNYRKGRCNGEGCNYKCEGYSFIGNHSNNYMDLIINIENGRVLDIYECSSFKNIAKNIVKNKRIKIDENKDPF